MNDGWRWLWFATGITMLIVAGLFLAALYHAGSRRYTITTPEAFCASVELIGNHIFDGRAKEFCREVRTRQFPDKAALYEDGLRKFGIIP